MDNKKNPMENREVAKTQLKGQVTKKKQSSTQKAIEEFVNDDLKRVGDYILNDILIPALKDTIVDGVSNGIEYLVRGEVRGRRDSRRISSGTSYTKYYRSDSRRSYSDRDYEERDYIRRRSSRDVDSYYFDFREDAIKVLDEMKLLLEESGVVYVADYFIKSDENYIPRSTDYDWGWHDLRFADVKYRGGKWYIVLPRTEVV